MEFNIQIEGRHAYMILFVLVLGFASVLVFSQGGPIQGHPAEEITPGTFSGGGEYIFPAGSKVGIGGTSPQADLDMGAGGIRLGDVTKYAWPGADPVVTRRGSTGSANPKGTCDPQFGQFNAEVSCNDDEILLQCGSSASGGRQWADVDHFDVGTFPSTSGRLYRKDNTCRICLTGSTAGWYEDNKVTVYAFCMKK